MNYIKKFESFQTHDEIHEICRKYNITNYTINEDGSIDVNDDVYLSFKGIKKIPLRFNKVSGNFDCAYNRLTTLECGPQSVDGDFLCYANKLTTLKGAPSSVNGDFKCYKNNLTTLKYAPNSVGGDFSCAENKLTTLEGAPQSVNRFYCYFNKDLKSLKYLSKYIATDEVYFDDTPVYEIFELLDNDSLGMIRHINELKVVVDDKINIEILNDLLYDQDKPPVEKVKDMIIYRLYIKKIFI